MIRTENLSMHYGPVKALDEVNFEIKKGDVIGLLGPNGAGKSTTLKIITTYVFPTEGTAYVNGIDVRKNPMPVRQMIGYLPEQLPIYMDMEVRDYLRFVGNARGLYGINLSKRLDWVVNKCGLKQMYRKVIRELSKGYKQRTALAQALLHDPEIIILDEPTSGLDPHQILEIRALIQELAGEKTIIFSTHILQEVEAVANRIMIINRGKIVADGNEKELQDNATEKRRISLSISEKTDSESVEKSLSKLEEVDEVSVVGKDDGHIRYLIEGKPELATQNAVSQLVQKKKWDLYELKYNPMSLEEIFLALTKPEQAKKGEG